jgi:hypothetical protein
LADIFLEEIIKLVFITTNDRRVLLKQEATLAEAIEEIAA